MRAKTPPDIGNLVFLLLQANKQTNKKVIKSQFTRNLILYHKNTEGWKLTHDFWIIDLNLKPKTFIPKVSIPYLLTTLEHVGDLVKTDQKLITELTK